MKNFFSKLFSIFKKAWFWWLFGLIVLCALVWFVFPLIKFGSVAPFAKAAVRLSIILVLVIVWAIINIILVKKSKAEDAEEENSTDPEKVRQALALLKLNFDKACDVVAQGAWGARVSKKNAYALPWYISLGLPNSGRSSLLRQSGLPYPVANESYQQIEQGEDELCQFWFSKNAVIIDTHDDLVSETKEDSVPQRVYSELLALLKQYRRKQPLNGVIVNIDIKDLLEKNEKQRAQMAHLWRTQLQLLNNTLGIQCPIYVVFTKCDLLSGFSEYFAHSNLEQQQQVFGFTLPYSKTKDSISFFAREYDAFIEGLHDDLLAHLQIEKDPRKAAMVENFPAQFAAAKEILQQYLTDIFESNHYQQPHATRGVFFTSSKQQGVPFDALENVSEKNYGISVVNEQENKGKTAYFIHDVFTKVIFAEKEVLLFNALQSKKQNGWRYSSFAFTALMCLLGAYLLTNSFVSNKQALNLVNQNVAEFNAIPANLTGDNKLFKVLPLLNEMRDLRSVFTPADDPRSMRWGLYQGDKIDEVAEEIYRKNLTIYFVPYIIEVVVDELKNPEAKPNQTYNALRVYLMLATPEKMNPEFMRNWLTTYWQRKYPSQPTLVSSLLANLNALLQMDIKPITVDANLVKQARMKLQHTTQAQRDYFELQELAEISQSSVLYITNGLNLDFNTVFGSEASKVGVPALYTKKGYDTIYKEQLAKVLENEGYSNWILGEYARKSLSDEAGTPEIAEQVRSFYMKDYIAQWTRVLESLHINKFASLKQAGNFLQIASSSTSPIYEVLNTIKENTQLSPAAQKGGSGALAKTQQFLKDNKRLVKAVQPKSVKKVTGKSRKFMPKSKKGKGSVAALENPLEKTPVGEHFTKLNDLSTAGEGKEASSGLDKIIEALENLSQVVNDMSSSSNPNEKAYEFVDKHMQGENNEDALTQLKTLAKTAPAPVKEWLTTIANSTWNTLLIASRDYINKQYSAEVLPEYNKNIADHFPFSKTAKAAVDINKFNEFFAKDGKFEKFYTQYMEKFIDTTKSTWTMKNIDGYSLPISDATLAQLQRAYDIKVTFFPEGAATPKLDYKIKVSTLSARLKSANLNLNGKHLDYRHGPKRSVDFTWPTEGGQDLYTLVLTDLGDNVKRFSEKGVWGPFALFLKAGTTQAARSSNVTAAFANSGRSVSYILSADTAQNPFSPNLLPAFRLPANLGDK